MCSERLKVNLWHQYNRILNWGMEVPVYRSLIMESIRENVPSPFTHTHTHMHKDTSTIFNHCYLLLKIETEHSCWEIMEDIALFHTLDPAISRNTLKREGEGDLPQDSKPTALMWPPPTAPPTKFATRTCIIVYLINYLWYLFSLNNYCKSLSLSYPDPLDFVCRYSPCSNRTLASSDDLDQNAKCVRTSSQCVPWIKILSWLLIGSP